MVATTDPDARVGSVLDGRYKILERLAEGGMGIVYRAERVPVGRPVAIKFLHKVFADDRESRARFERETRVLSKLAHPHCVSVIDFGVDGGPYLVMDFVGGTTLRSILDEGPLPPPQAIALARQILAGLAHAHEQGIIHRDIKPANIMVSDEIGTGRHVRILDFGLARLRGTAATSVTISTIVVGTPSYMAPEQTVGGELSARTDLYAVGVVLFEMLTGDRPFIADEAPQLLELHRTAPVPRLVDRAPGVAFPRGLDAVIERAMAKDSAERWSSAVAFSDALDNVARRNALPMPRLASQPVYQIVDGDRDKDDDDASEVDATSAEVPRSKSTRSSRTSARGLGNFIIWALLLAGAVVAYVMISKAAQDATSRSKGSTTRTSTGTSGSGGSAKTGSAGSAAAKTPVTADAAVAIAPPVVADAADVAIAPMVDADAADVAIATPPVDDAAPAVIDQLPDAGANDDPEIEITTEEAPEADPLAPDNDVAQAPDEPDPGGTDSEPAPLPDVTPPTATAIAPAKTVAQALAQLKRGGKANRDAAITGLRQQWQKNPRSARLPYILGNIYFGMRWWSIGMQHYRAAIKRGPGYRRNPTLIRNVISALASTKTRGKAAWFLRNVIGKAARPYVRNAARYHAHPAVKAAAKRIRI